MIDALVQGFSGPGSGFMYAITAILAFGLAVLIERAFLYWVRWRIDAAAVLSAIAGGARADLGHHPSRALVEVGTAAPAGRAWDAMAVQAPLVEAAVRRRVGYLATIGNIATMIGLLGTVYGLILAFHGLSDASAVERDTALSQGIATAMSTTAWGLLVGIPALAAHALLDGKSSAVLATCEAIAAQVAAARGEPPA